MIAPPVRLGCVLVLLNAVPVSAYLPTSTTRAYLGNISSYKRAMISGDRLSGLYGPLGSDAQTTTTTDQFVAGFLAANKDALGVDDVALEFVRKRTLRNGKFALYHYRQEIEDLPVEHSWVRILVLLGSTEKISYVPMHLMQPPATALPTDILTDEDALEVVQESPLHEHLTAYDGLSSFSKVIYEATNMKLHRAWRFEGWDADEHYRFFVDTASGAIVGVESQLHAYTGKVKVQGDVELCCHPGRPDWPSCCPSGLADCCCLESDPNWPECMYPCCGFEPDGLLNSKTTPLADVQVAQTTNACPAGESSWQPTRVTDVSGEYDFQGCSGAGCNGNHVCARLLGQWATVYCINIGGSNTSVISQCIDAVDPATQVSIEPDACCSTECCTVTPLTCAQEPDCAAYAATAFSVVERTHEWLLDIDSSLWDLQNPINV